MAKTKIAILGAGAIAQIMADTVKHMDEIELYAVAARDLKRAEEFAKKNGFLNAYGSYEEMLNDDNVELVYVATPHSHHYEHAKLCINKGRAVLCEKAFMANAKQTEEILALAKEKNVFITEAIWTRFMPLLKTIKEIMASGIIGDIRMLTCNLSYSIAHVERMYKPELAGGALLDLGIYVLHFAAMMFGTDIKSMTSACVKAPTGVDEQDSITLIYEDGKMAVLNATYSAVGDRRGIIYGSKGYILIENINNYAGVKVYDLDYKEIASYPQPKQITGYEYEVLGSIEALKNGWLECPAIPHEETLRIMKQMDELRKEWGIKFPFE